MTIQTALTVDDFVRRAADNHAQQVGRGEHDGRCEWSERRLFCECRKRRRIAEGRTELPTIEFPYPICGGCNREVEHDSDSFVCERCSARWSERATDGDKATSWTDDYGLDGGDPR